MRIIRPAIAVDPRRFGRGVARDLSAPPAATLISDDLKLFGATFLGGFLFVSILLA